MLSSKEWKEFQIDKLFETSKGVYLHKKYIKEGNNPYITATSGNNGVSDFILNDALFEGSAITIEKIRFSAYYQPHSFYCSHDVSVLKSEHLNKHVALFINNMIMKQGSKFSYGRQAQLNVAKRQSILLPVTDKGEPDYRYMEDYVRELEKQKINEYKDYISSKLSELKYQKIPALNEKSWNEFFVTDVFPEIQRGKRLTKANQVNGDIPYVSSTAMNNGVDNFIQSGKKMRLFSNCLSIANSGSVGSSFYEPFEFVASDHITHFKNEEFDMYIYLFIATITSRWSEKYNFNREINDDRIKREIIILPVDDEGKPDLEYMRQYIKNLMIKKYQAYLDYKNN